MRNFPSASWRFARTEPRFIPDEVILRSYQSNLGQRFVVEARQQGRLLGDKDFSTHADAVAFGRVESGWYGIRLTDNASGARG